MRDSHLHLLLVLATPEMLTHIRIANPPNHQSLPNVQKTT